MSNPLESWQRGAALRVPLSRVRRSRGRDDARRALPAPGGRSGSAGGDLARAADRARPAGARPVRARCAHAARRAARALARTAPHEERARRDEGARHGDLRHVARARSRPCAADRRRAHRASAPRPGRRRQPARGGVRRQRRPRLEREPDPRRRRREPRRASVVLLAGVAGLAAGAFAMAAGEYVSVRSQRELFEYQIGLERDELAEYPDAEAQELALIYAAKGLPREGGEQAREASSSPIRSTRSTRWRARSLGSIPRSWARRGAPRSRRSSRSRSARCCRCSRSSCAPGPNALPIAIGVTAVALFAVGACLSLFTGRSAWRSGAAHAGAGRDSPATVTVRDRSPRRRSRAIG